jgi:hypothetical protein
MQYKDQAIKRQSNSKMKKLIVHTRSWYRLKKKLSLTKFNSSLVQTIASAAKIRRSTRIITFVKVVA